MWFEFCIEFFNLKFKSKNLTDFNNLFSPKNIKNNNKNCLKLFSYMKCAKTKALTDNEISCQEFTMIMNEDRNYWTKSFRMINSKKRYRKKSLRKHGGE